MSHSWVYAYISSCLVWFYIIHCGVWSKANPDNVRNCKQIDGIIKNIRLTSFFPIEIFLAAEKVRNSFTHAEYDDVIDACNICRNLFRCQIYYQFIY